MGKDKKEKVTQWTQKKERLCIEYAINGKSQSDAYRSAYNAGNMSDKSIWETASKLFSEHKVSSRIEELRADMVEKAIWTKERSIKVLAEIAENKKEVMIVSDDGIEEVKHSDRISATRELNSMHGWKEQKIDNTSSDGTMTPAQMTPEQRQAEIDRLLGEDDE